MHTYKLIPEERERYIEFLAEEYKYSSIKGISDKIQALHELKEISVDKIGYSEEVAEVLFERYLTTDVVIVSLEQQNCGLNPNHYISYMDAFADKIYEGYKPFFEEIFKDEILHGAVWTYYFYRSYTMGSFWKENIIHLAGVNFKDANFVSAIFEGDMYLNFRSIEKGEPYFMLNFLDYSDFFSGFRRLHYSLAELESKPEKLADEEFIRKTVDVAEKLRQEHGDIGEIRLPTICSDKITEFKYTTKECTYYFFIKRGPLIIIDGDSVDMFRIRQRPPAQHGYPNPGFLDVCYCALGNVGAALNSLLYTGLIEHEYESPVRAFMHWLASEDPPETIIAQNATDGERTLTKEIATILRSRGH